MYPQILKCILGMEHWALHCLDYFALTGELTARDETRYRLCSGVRFKWATFYAANRLLIYSAQVVHGGPGDAIPPPPMYCISTTTTYHFRLGVSWLSLAWLGWADPHQMENCCALFFSATTAIWSFCLTRFYGPQICRFSITIEIEAKKSGIMTLNINWQWWKST